MSFDNLPDVQHPFTQYTLRDAVSLAVSNAKTFEHRVPQTLDDVRKYIDDMAKRSGHNWLTGAAALDVLDAAIDGTNLRVGCRFC
jgi:hypothetical protein